MKRALIVLCLIATPAHAEETAQFQMFGCWDKAARDYGAKSCQPPSELARAALGSCPGFEYAYAQTLTDLTAAQVKQHMDEARAAMMNGLIAHALDAQITRKCP